MMKRREIKRKRKTKRRNGLALDQEQGEAEVDQGKEIDMIDKTEIGLAKEEKEKTEMEGEEDLGREKEKDVVDQ